MSPEQAIGKRVDKRADIWAFGAVLWEMLTGSRVFGASASIPDAIADVLRTPIDFSKLPQSTPAPIIQLIRRCLDRNPKTRLRDIGEARVAIAAYLANPRVAELRGNGPQRMGARAAWFVAAAAVTVAAGLAFIHFREALPTAARDPNADPDARAPGQPAVCHLA